MSKKSWSREGWKSHLHESLVLKSEPALHGVGRYYILLPTLAGNLNGPPVVYLDKLHSEELSMEAALYTMVDIIAKRVSHISHSLNPLSKAHNPAVKGSLEYEQALENALSLLARFQFYNSPQGRLLGFPPIFEPGFEPEKELSDTVRLYVAFLLDPTVHRLFSRLVYLPSTAEYWN